MMTQIIPTQSTDSYPARWAQLLDDLHQIAQHSPTTAFANSLGAEDMVLQHALSVLKQTHPELSITSFVIDTGRLHSATLQLIDTIEQRYGTSLTVLHPDPEQVEAHVKAHGAFAFYESLALRKACCTIRKVSPLQTFLPQFSAWITGQRKDQAVTRAHLDFQEQDEVFGLIKFNPLRDWSFADVWTAIRHQQIPYNPLHDQGYPSIGCEPCTRAIKPDEDLRAGRWWWEQRDSVECGLHASNLEHSQH